MIRQPTALILLFPVSGRLNRFEDYVNKEGGAKKTNTKKSIKKKNAFKL